MDFFHNTNFGSSRVFGINRIPSTQTLITRMCNILQSTAIFDITIVSFGDALAGHRAEWWRRFIIISEGVSLNGHLSSS